MREMTLVTRVLDTEGQQFSVQGPEPEGRGLKTM